MTTHAAAPPTHADWAAELAHLVYRTRIEADLTQADLARALGTNQATVTAWEDGSCAPDVEALDDVARACGQHLEITIGR
ncbi:helix-turn-helix transcriptional regulator [Mycobacterium sp. pUA109]|uniref:helix-turn-helix transcriptional regulator n=1 Tax=Mycobacterium sp. pUA109 TaxID=3238982 RepID=UPI00351B6A65